jgi:hypothetical protein
MVNSCTVKCSTASGKTLDELSRMIALRVERLNELTRDAVIATAIDILVSLRSLTADARKGDKADPPQRITTRSDLVVSFRNGAAHKPCLRYAAADGHGAVFSQPGSFYIATDGVALKQLKVFQIVPRHERIKPYFVAATSPSEALKFEGDKIRRRIRSKGGLARAVLGAAMAAISTRNGDEGVSPKIRALSARMSQTIVSAGGATGASGSAGVSFVEELEYAMAALNGGDGAVELAMQKAANKIAGLITKTAHEAGDFEHDIRSPFPDVKKRG